MQAERRDSALAKRVLSGAVMVALAIVDLWVGGWLFALSVVVVVALMADEWGRLANDLPPPAQKMLTAVVAVAAGGAAAVAAVSGSAVAIVVLFLGTMAGAGILAVAQRIGASRAAAGICYLGLPAVALVWLRGAPDDRLLPLLWLLLVVWATDIFAYFVGRGVGGAKLAPAISPGKTWAGLVGGMLGAGLVAAALGAASGGAVAIGLAAAMLLAVVAQLGDLFESFMKRRAGVKDSGSLIPGHGGVLDRLDGLLFAAPIYALLTAAGVRVVG